jgi:hypothetical protein
MSGKLTALTYSTYKVRHTVASHCFRASHPITTYSYGFGKNTVRLQHDCRFDVFLPTHMKTALITKVLKVIKSEAKY